MPTPSFGWFIKEIKHFKSLRKLFLKLLKFPFQQNVVFSDLSLLVSSKDDAGREGRGRDIAEDQGDFGFIFRVFEDGFDELIHGGDPSSTSN